MAEQPMKGADGLRTLACLMVVFHHLSQQLVFNPGIQAPAALRAVAEFFASSGSAGVSVFFVLSGFLLALPFWRAYFDGGALPDLRVYAARRAARIMPGFYLNLLFFFLVAAAFTPEAPALLVRYFAGLTFTAGFHWLTFFPAEGNGPLWSIGFEVVSYVLMPLGMLGLFALLGKKRSAAKALGWWAAVWFVVFALNQVLQAFVTVEDLGKGWQNGLSGGAKFWMPRYNPIGFFGHFALGTIAAGVATLWSRSQRPLSPWWFDAFSTVLTVLWVFILVSRTNQDQFSWTLQGQPYYFPLFAGTTALLLACLTQSRWAARLFDNPFSRYTARISFGLYLWHTLVITGFNGALGDTLEWLLLVLVVLVASYAVATLSWKFWEEPILRRVQAWKPGIRRGPSRFPLFVAASAFVLVAAPLLVSSARPSVWNFPTTAGTVFSFHQPGPITGLASDGHGGWFAAFRGSEIHRIGADRRYQLMYTLPEAADLRLTYDRPPRQPLAIPTPGLIVLKNELPFLWNLRVGPDGRLYAAAGDRVLVFTAEGTLIKALPVARAGTFGVMDVAFAGGKLLVPNGPQILSVDPETGAQGVFLEDGNFTQAAGVAYDGVTLVVTDFDPLHLEHGKLLVYDASSGVPRTPKVLEAPAALFPVLHGEVYAAKAFSNSLYRWSSTKGLETLWLPNSPAQGALAWSGGRLFASSWNGSLAETALGGAP